MTERPTAAELIEAVREFLERDVMTALEGRLSFHARVAVNVLAIVERELQLGEEHEAAERARLAELLGHGGDIDGLRTELAAAIRSGALDDRREALVVALRATASEALAVANPEYRGPKYLG
jgi:hypothetical protein